ncbi:FAD binding domain-containing protein [Mycena pura]|uniref:FAD binding domain-containing protein n=1 Tax=Mycena pura TaxID=153505 RepID=A0AAD6Y730_9AGAR|nr:FAD binding domain-containing protein [Mycena pura]
MSGVSVRIIDKEPSYRVGRRGAGITPRTLEVFKMLGVLEGVLKLAHKPAQFQSYELPEGVKPSKTWSMSSTLEPTPACPFLNAVFLGQDQVEAILRERLKGFGYFVELGTKLLDFEQHADGVRATILSNDEKEGVKAKYIVGADGAKGIVRKRLGLSFLGEACTEDELVVSDVIVDGLDLEHVHMWTRGTAVTILVWPGQTETNVFSIQMSGEELDRQKVVSDPDELEFRRFFREQTGRADIYLGEIVWISEYVPNIRMVEELGKDRTFLVGDAAHAHSLIGGQGMNSSVQDSFNLGWKLSCVVLGVSSPELLSTYSEERLPVIAEMLNKPTELHTKAFKSNNLVDPSHWKRGKSLSQLGINYRWSSIVTEETPKTDDILHAYGQDGEGAVLLRAGDRAPNAPGLVDVEDKLTSERSLFEVFKYSAHTVLIFCRPAPEERSTVDEILQLTSHLPQRVQAVIVYPGAVEVPSGGGLGRLEADLVFWDQDGHAFREYHVPADKVHSVVVRPDGMVGAIVSSVPRLTQYFGTIFQLEVRT